MKPLLFTCKYGGAVEVTGAGEIMMNDAATRWLNTLTELAALLPPLAGLACVGAMSWLSKMSAVWPLG
jgi:hypothetical protein